eukprot:9284460-Pyramimonas_sp.AAC.1
MVSVYYAAPFVSVWNSGLRPYKGGFAPPEGEFVLPEGGFALSRSGRALLGWARGSSIGLTTSDKWESVVTEKRKRHAEQQVQEEQRAEYEKRRDMTLSSTKL